MSVLNGTAVAKAPIRPGIYTTFCQACNVHHPCKLVGERWVVESVDPCPIAGKPPTNFHNKMLC
jgi:hypothetical protein